MTTSSRRRAPHDRSGRDLAPLRRGFSFKPGCLSNRQWKVSHSYGCGHSQRRPLPLNFSPAAPLFGGAFVASARATRVAQVTLRSCHVVLTQAQLRPRDHARRRHSGAGKDVGHDTRHPRQLAPSATTRRMSRRPSAPAAYTCGHLGAKLLIGLKGLSRRSLGRHGARDPLHRFKHCRDGVAKLAFEVVLGATQGNRI
jgi:hypothetical protein